MKLFKYILGVTALILVAAANFGCRADETSADAGNQRLQMRIDEYTNALQGASDGWIMEMNTERGGIHTIWLRFGEKGRVEMMFDYVEYYREWMNFIWESTYRIKQRQLPTLSFDTYSLISIFADPNQLNNGAGAAGVGLGADFEYEIRGYKNDEFTLVGVKNGQAATLRHATKEEYEKVNNGELMSNVDDSPTYQPSFYRFEYNGTYYDFVSNGRSTGFMYVDGLEPTIELKGSKIDFEGNIIMMEPLELDGNEIHYFTKTDNGYSVNLGSTVLSINKSAEPVVSLLGAFAPAFYYRMISTNSMQNRWSSEYFFTYRQALQNLFYWTINNLGMGRYLQYTALIFYQSGEVVLEFGFNLYTSSGLDTSKVYAHMFIFDPVKNPDGSLTFNEDYKMMTTGNPEDPDIEECLRPMLDYYAGNTFYVKPWPSIYNGEPMVALVPADRELGVVVGLPSNN